MRLYKFRHPKIFKFLSENGFISSNESNGSLPDLNVLLSALASPSSDDQKFILIPIILGDRAKSKKSRKFIIKLNFQTKNVLLAVFVMASGHCI